LGEVIALESDALANKDPEAALSVCALAANYRDGLQRRRMNTCSTGAFAVVLRGVDVASNLLARVLIAAKRKHSFR
jgi:hypothetical protein